MRRLYLAFFLLAVAFLLPLEAEGAPPRVDVIKVNGSIVPVVADYIQRGIDHAQDGAQALVIELDTPGGLTTTTQVIVEAILNSTVPVVVYVSPAGAWAGSAGAFITLAGHVAAMAPGTFIGAAHPVTLGGADELPQPQEEKLVNALASTIRSIAQERRRNVEAAEDMVRQSLAKTDNEALELNLIDLRAENLSELLDRLEGRQITLSGYATTTLHTRGAEVNRVPMTFAERFLHAISDPNIAYILLSLALLGIAVEFSNPGAILPGVVGGIALFLSLYSLGILGASWTGVLLMFLAFAMLVAEAFVPSHGLLAAGGVTSMLMGSFLLFSGTAFTVNRWLVVGMALGLGAFFFFAISAVVRTHRQPQQTGREGMAGITAVAKTPLNPGGTVLAHGELWEAVSLEGPIQEREEVIIQRLEGLKLSVIRKKK
ncbi:MAG: nodulation protein NfeD [Chloroflexota bacterium]